MCIRDSRSFEAQVEHSASGRLLKVSKGAVAPHTVQTRASLAAGAAALGDAPEPQPEVTPARMPDPTSMTPRAT